MWRHKFHSNTFYSSLLIFFFFFWKLISQCVSMHLIFWTHWTISILPTQFFHFLFCLISFCFMNCAHTRCNNAQDTQGSCPGGLHSLPEPGFLCFSSPLVSILGAFQPLSGRPCPASCRVGSSQVTSWWNLASSLPAKSFLCTSQHRV